MPKIVITKELAETLKTLRVQNNIKSAELATHIGKSAAYVSKLEKGDIQSLKTDSFESILNFILKGEENKDVIIETLYSSLKVKYSEEEINQQIWFNNFDTVFRIIPLPFELIDEINELISTNHISKRKLLNIINDNQFLSEEDINDDSIPYNEWYNDENNGICIKIQLEDDLFENILNKKVDSSPYIFPYAILFYIFVIISNKQINEMSNADIRNCQDNATTILNKHKFYSIIERERLFSGKTESEREELLSSFDRTSKKIIFDILNHLKFLSETDVVKTNERLQCFLENIDSDAWFMLKLISLGYYKLESIGIQNKKSFLSDLEKLINEYSNTHEHLETY